MKNSKIATIVFLIFISLSICFTLASCGNVKPAKSTAQPPIENNASINTSNVVMPSAEDDTVASISLSGQGNTPSNLLHGGTAVEYDGFIYHVDEMIEGNIWRTPVAGGESELLCKGSFCALNVNGGLIFSLLSFPDPDSELKTGGICVMNTDGSDAKILKEGYFSRIILNDEYLYYADGSDGALHRMKFDGSEDTVLLQEEIYDSFLLINGAIYLFTDLDEEYVTNIYRMSLDGSTGPNMVVEDIFGGIDVGFNEIFYSARDNTSKMFRYNTETGESSIFWDEWIDNINYSGDYLYYFWNGVRADDLDAGLYRMKTDTSENQMLLQVNELYSLNIAGEKLFWENNDDLRRLTVANLDCTDIQFVEKVS